MKKSIFTVIILLLTWGNLSAQTDTIFRSFTVKQVDEGVLISFTIRGGIICSGVKIEKSDDGVKFQEVYEFAGVCGSVNTDETYSYIDENPFINSNSYYRLDLGSIGLYSDVLPLLYIQYNSSGVSFFPNPCTDVCTLYFVNDSRIPHRLILLDGHGKIMLEETTTRESLNIDRSNLPAGLYFYRLIRNEEVRFSGKVLII